MSCAEIMTGITLVRHVSISLNWIKLSGARINSRLFVMRVMKNKIP